MMFKNTRAVLDNFESAYQRVMFSNAEFVAGSDEQILDYFNVDLAKALMQDSYILDESVAKIILATRGMSSEITVKVE